MRDTVAAALLAAFGLGAVAPPARATALNALPQSSGINATDTVPVCQIAAGCGPANALTQMPMAAILGTIGTAITSATTLGNSYNNIVTPVSGIGYAITLPQSTASVLPPGSKVLLDAAPGAAVDVCTQSGSAFDTNSAAPLAAGLCSGGASGVALAGGQTLSITAEGNDTYFASLAISGIGIEAAKTGNYTVSYTADVGRTIPLNCGSAGCTVTLPVATSFPAGQWVTIVAEIVTGDHNDLVATTSPSTLYGVPNNISDPGTVSIVPGMGTKAISDGTNWFLIQWATIPSQDSFSGTSYTPDVWDCYQTRHFTSASAVTVAVPTGLPAGCYLSFAQDGAGQVEVVGGSGFTLDAYNGDAHSAGQFATFFVEIESGGTTGILGGNIAP